MPSSPFGGFHRRAASLGATVRALRQTGTDDAMYPLKPQDRRVLVPIGTACAFGCAYCYANAESIYPASAMRAAEIFAAFAELNPADYDIIQLGYDGDPFASRKRFVELAP